MPLAQGTRLGLYAIEAPLGAGGMGQVYGRRHATAPPRKVMAVDVRTQPFDGAQGGPTLHVSRPRMLFEGDDVTAVDSGRHYHAMPDGRLLMLKGRHCPGT